MILIDFALPNDIEALAAMVVAYAIRTRGRDDPASKPRTAGSLIIFGLHAKMHDSEVGTEKAIHKGIQG